MPASLPTAIRGGAALFGTAGSLLTSDGGGDRRSPSDLPGTGFSSDTDSLQSQLEILSLINLGASPEQVVPQGGPAMSLLNAIGTGAAGDIRQEGQGIVAQVVGAINAEVDAGLRAGLSADQIVANVNANPVVRFHGPGFIIQQPLAVTGFGTLDDLVRAEVSFTQNRNTQVERLTELLPDIQAGQEAALRGAAQILQDFPVPTQANIDQLSQSFEEDILRQRRVQANTGGFPVDLRNVGREGQQQALELLTGQQTVAGNALNAFLGSNAAAVEAGLAVSSQGQAGALGAAQLTSSQAIALSGPDPPGDNNTSDMLGLLGGLGFQQLLANPPTGGLPGSGGGGAPATGTANSPFGF